MSRARVVLISGMAFVAVLAVSLVAWRAHVRALDATICAQLQHLDGVTDRPDVLWAIHAAGKQVNDHLGHIVRNAEGGNGSLSLVSEDYDYVLSRCADLGLPAPHVDH